MRVVIAVIFPLLSSTSLGAAPPEPTLAPEVSFPNTGSAIPLNARILFFGEPRDELSFERIDLGVSLSFSQEPSTSGTTEQMFIVDPGPLVAGEQLIIQPRCPICVDQAVFTFDVLDVVDDTPPVVADEPASEPQVGAASDGCIGFETFNSFSVSVTLPDVVDDSGPVLVRTVSTAGDLSHTRSDIGEPDEPMQVFFFARAGPLREECATSTAIDVAGNETALEPICAEVGTEGGCAQSSHVVPVAMLAMFLRGRRRR